MSLMLPATTGLNPWMGTRVVDPDAAACRVPPSIEREPGPVIAVPSGDGAVLVVVPGVAAQPAARLTTRRPCTTSAVCFIAPLLFLLSFITVARSRSGRAAAAWPTAPAPPYAARRASTRRADEAPPRRPPSTRSEERRVGKEGRSRWSPYH